jgi:ribonuclease T1
VVATAETLAQAGISALAIANMSQTSGSGGSSGSTGGTQDPVPQKAHDVCEHVQKTGGPPKDYEGGWTFENREGKLPQGGDYREFDIDPKIPGTGRNAERIVLDMNNGRAWYTPNHYNTFVEIK